MKERNEHSLDKLGLFILAGLAIAVLGGIVYGSFYKGVPDGSDALLGGIATGVLLFARDVIQAIRGAWGEATMGKMSDQLGKSQPVDGGPVPADAAAAADQVADAAVERADEIRQDERP